MSTNFKDQPIKEELFERFNQKQSGVFALINEQYETLLEFAKYQEYFFNQLPKYNRTNPVNFRAALKERCGLDFDRIICKLQSYSYRQEEMLKAILGQCYDAEKNTKLGNPLEQWGILNAEKKYKPNDIYPWRACIPAILPLVLNEITQGPNDQNEKPLQEEQEDFKQTLLDYAKKGEHCLSRFLYDRYGLNLEVVRRIFQEYESDTLKVKNAIEYKAEILARGENHPNTFQRWSTYLTELGFDIASESYQGDIDSIKSYSELSKIGIEYHPTNVFGKLIDSIPLIYFPLLQYLEKSDSSSNISEDKRKAEWIPVVEAYAEQLKQSNPKIKKSDAQKKCLERAQELNLKTRQGSNIDAENIRKMEYWKYWK